MRCVMDSRLPHREGRKERKMAKASPIHLPTSIGGATTFISKPSSLYYPSHLWSKVMKPTKVHAKLGGGDGEIKSTGQKKKFITKEEEPDQYWQTAGERKGENPMTTPLPYIIIFGMSTPFVILAIAFANGWIKVPVR